MAHRGHLLRGHLDDLRPNAGTLLKRLGLENYQKRGANET